MMIIIIIIIIIIITDIIIIIESENSNTVIQNQCVLLMSKLLSESLASYKLTSTQWNKGTKEA